MSPLEITIPGEPVAQARPKVCVIRGHAHVYDAKVNREWRGIAQVHMLEALARAGLTRPPFFGPLRLELLAVFMLARSHWRKLPRRRQHHTSRPDLSNILKAVEDAGNGILWLDDRQVCEVQAAKIFGWQGEAPKLVVTVIPLQAARP
jgi:Holliday junction resolvase RusA-like endonuclease